MRIGVVSDTHGEEWAVKACILAAGHVDAWIHLGDNVRDTGPLEETGVPVYVVRGNTDLGNICPAEEVIELGGKRILLCHGHQYGVGSGLTRLALRAEELKCACALFGHTHIPLLEEGGPITFMNPGSPARPRGGSRRSMGTHSIRQGQIDGCLIPLP